MAIAQNIGTTITALLPALFAAVAPPGSTNIPVTVGAITFVITVVAALAAWSARETYRVHLNDLGDPRAIPVPKRDYDLMRAQTISNARAAA
jgi:Na+/melibiose symporter-like transporter